MKTPCQKLGYKAGDKFEIIRENNDGFLVGTIVRLCKDNGTAMPLFSGNNLSYRLHGGKEGAFTRLENVKPIKPKKAAEPAQEAQAEPTAQREANGRPVGAKVGDWFRVVGDTAYGEVGDIVQFIQDDLSPWPWFLGDNTDGESPIHWHSLEPCPAPSQPEPEPAKPEWEILWGSAEDFEGAPDWAVYVSPAGSFLEDVIRGARLSYGNGVESIVRGVANCRPKAARRLKQPK